MKSVYFIWTMGSHLSRKVMRPYLILVRSGGGGFWKPPELDACGRPEEIKLHSSEGGERKLSDSRFSEAGWKPV